MTQSVRTQEFRRNARQEELLQEVNDLLAYAEQRVLRAEARGPSKPILFIVGAPRSGTTLMLQWLAGSGRFAYPTNLLSRFFKAPYTGARIQQLLTDPAIDYRGELSNLTDGGARWSSDAGKTRGVLQPHEFFYFWRRFFPIDQAQKLSDEQLEASDPEGFVGEWGIIERALGKPVAAKGILLQYDIDRLAEWLPTSVFIFTQRDTFFNIQSLLHTRERVFGNRGTWFSVRPPGYDWLRHENPYTQLAGQVLLTNRAIEAALCKLPASRTLSVEYESFCHNPGVIWDRLHDQTADLGLFLEDYRGPSAFTCTNEVLCSEEEAALIHRACRVVACR